MFRSDAVKAFDRDVDLGFDALQRAANLYPNFMTPTRTSQLVDLLGKLELPNIQHGVVQVSPIVDVNQPIPFLPSDVSKNVVKVNVGPYKGETDFTVDISAGLKPTTNAAVFNVYVVDKDTVTTSPAIVIVNPHKQEPVTPDHRGATMLHELTHVAQSFRPATLKGDASLMLQDTPYEHISADIDAFELRREAEAYVVTLAGLAGTPEGDANEENIRIMRTEEGVAKLKAGQVSILSIVCRLVLDGILQPEHDPSQDVIDYFANNDLIRAEFS